MAASPEATREIGRRWDRRARVYDLLMAPMERMMGFTTARAWVVARAAKGRVLEIGAGTGRNLRYYPAGTLVVATDVSPRMLARAAGKAAGRPAVRFVVADAERLPFRDGAFDRVVATFVFCSVADPVRALRDVRRVLRDDGEAVLLEHMRPHARLGRLFDLLDPLVSRLWGPHINRRTLENVRSAGLVTVEERRIVSDWVKIIIVR